GQSPRSPGSRGVGADEPVPRIMPVPPNCAVEQTARRLRMPAYFIVDNEVTDPAGFEEYRKQVPGTVEKYGGKFLVRGGQMQTLEGDWKPKRIVVTEFPSIEQARRWYDSEEYRALKALRLRTARGSVVLVEGVS